MDQSNVEGRRTMSRRGFVLLVALVMTMLAVPMSASAASPKGHGEGTWKLADGTVVVLSKLNAPSSRFTALSQGYWNSGCYYAAYGPGGTIYSYTIWQTFGSNGSTINYLPAPTNSATTDVGYQLTAHSNTHWWVNSTHKDAAAQGTWTFTQYISGQPFRSFSGWVEVIDHYNGTWSCYSS
jgi:hypothetical protein